MDEPPASFRRLDSQKIVESAHALRDRIGRRFPDSGLGNLSHEIVQVAEETVARIDWIQRPHIPLRVGVAFLTITIVAILIGLLIQIRQFQLGDFGSFVQALESSIGTVVFIGAAVLFLVNWENRIKRQRALKAVHELRALAHIVDMHQLTKDPENYFGRGQRPVAPPKREMTPFELNRYLDYCSDALALLSKIGALYVQDFQDSVLLDAVDDVEDLTSGLSRKIWQKITFLENMKRGGEWDKVSQS